MGKSGTGEKIKRVLVKAGELSWVAGDWSTGAGEDLGMSREEITEGERRKEKQK